MATFIAISGPSATGKTSLIEELRKDPRFSHVVISPDMHEKVWGDLVSQGFFSEFTEITQDSDYFCLYIIRLIDYYKNFIEQYEDTDEVVLLDGCWIDLSVYAVLNMWYTRVIKSLQEDILSRISSYDSRISKIYVTRPDDVNFPVDKYKVRGKISNFRSNRSLELQYYSVIAHLDNATALPSSDIRESASFIIKDLSELGYL